MENESNSCPVPNGILLIVGGHEDKGLEDEQKDRKSGSHPLEILKEFIRLTGKDHPVIEIITSAGSGGRDTFREYKRAFKEIGVNNIGHIHHDKRSEALSANLEDRLRKADGVYFSGGDQLKLTSVYGGTSILLTLKLRYLYGGIVLAGTSAGAMAFSTPMIFAGNKDRQQVVGGVKITTGLEFLKDVCIDTHFVDRSRFVRMAQVVATNPTCIGIGIEEDTAIVVRNGTDVDVVGAGTVIVVEGYNISDSNIVDYEHEAAIAIYDINVKLLSKNSKYTIRRMNPPHI